MDKTEYEQLLIKADQYFFQDKFNQFLTEFAKCYAFNSDCFNHDLNVFKFSLSNYSLTDNHTINEFNRFKLHLTRFLNSLDNQETKENYIVKIKGLIDKKYNEVCLYDPVINYQNFNDYCAIVAQLYELVSKCINEKLVSNQGIINDFLDDIKTKATQLRKINRWTVPARYAKHFVFLPQKPRQFLNDMMKKAECLRKRQVIQ